MKSQPGEENSQAKLTAAQVLDIRAKHAAGFTLRELADEFEVTHVTILRVVNRHTWKHLR